MDPAQDEYLKQIQEISAGIDTLEKKIKKIEQDLDGIEKVKNKNAINCYYKNSLLSNSSL